MSNGTQPRGTERLMLTIPIRVSGIDEAKQAFSEDTHTVVVNRAGARIELKRRVAPEDTIGILNLENGAEADFRVVGLMQPLGLEVNQWGVECLDKELNIWGIEFSSPLPAKGYQAGALLECRACGKQTFSHVTAMELEVLNSAGIITGSCDRCGKATYWTYADATRRPPRFPPFPEVTPPARVVEAKKRVEKRAHRRLLVKLPIRIRDQRDREDITRTEDFSVAGFAAYVAMELAEGELVTVACVHEGGVHRFEQQAQVRWRSPRLTGGRRLHGFCYVSKPGP